MPPPDRSRRPLPPESLAPPPPADRIATTVDKGHGRIEKRILRTTPHLTLTSLWKGAKQGVEITRQRTIGGKTTVEVVYGVTSLSVNLATAADLLQASRDHWAIENELHYVRDMTLGEDACRVRRGSTPQVLAVMRNAVIHLLEAIDAKSIRAAIEELQCRPDKAKKLIGIP